MINNINLIDFFKQSQPDTLFEKNIAHKFNVKSYSNKENLIKSIYPYSSKYYKCINVFLGVNEETLKDAVKFFKINFDFLVKELYGLTGEDKNNHVKLILNFLNYTPIDIDKKSLDSLFEKLIITKYDKEIAGIFVFMDYLVKENKIKIEDKKEYFCKIFSKIEISQKYQKKFDEIKFFFINEDFEELSKKYPSIKKCFMTKADNLFESDYFKVNCIQINLEKLNKKINPKKSSNQEINEFLLRLLDVAQENQHVGVEKIEYEKTNISANFKFFINEENEKVFEVIQAFMQESLTMIISARGQTKITKDDIQKIFFKIKLANEIRDNLQEIPMVKKENKIKI